jgi:hypothetical protein
VNAVYLHDDRVVLAFNYKDETKTVKALETKESFRSDLDALASPLQYCSAD